MAVRASISPHADPPSEWGPWTINFRAPAGQTEPASPWNHFVGFHSQAPLATTPKDSRIFKESSCLGACPVLKNATLGWWGWGEVLAKQAGGQHVMHVLNHASPPPPPPGGVVAVDSPLKKKKEKSKLQLFQSSKKKRQNLKQVSLISFKMFPGRGSRLLDQQENKL